MTNFISSVLCFVVAIGILVVIHEFGHYSVARLAGVKVLRFSIGFGKPLFQFRARNGTEWSLGWLPLGGYVKMLDEREFANAATTSPQDRIDPKDLPHAFNRQSVGKRFAIVAAGPVANFLLAILLFAILYLHGSPQPQAIIGTPPAHSAAELAGLNRGERIIGIRRSDGGEAVAIRSWPELEDKLGDAAEGQRSLTLLTQLDGGHYEHVIHVAPSDAMDATPLGSAPADDLSVSAKLINRLGLVPGGGAPLVAGIEPGSPAEKAGLRVGDQVSTADGLVMNDAQALVAYMRGHAGRLVSLNITRNGQPVTLQVTPGVVQDATAGKAVGRIGAALGSRLPTVDVRYGPLDSLRLGVARTWEISAFSVKMFGRMLTGQASIKNLSGPVTIADYAGRSARMGLEAFISFLALVSISLGVLNLLPIPVLDGGHLLYYAVEAVTGRAPSERWQSIMQRAGLLCIVALSVVALFNDLARLIHL